MEKSQLVWNTQWEDVSRVVASRLHQQAVQADVYLETTKRSKADCLTASGVGRTAFPAHRVILAAASPFLCKVGYARQAVRGWSIAGDIECCIIPKLQIVMQNRSYTVSAFWGTLLVEWISLWETSNVPTINTYPLPLKRITSFNSF